MLNAGISDHLHRRSQVEAHEEDEFNAEEFKDFLTETFADFDDDNKEIVVFTLPTISHLYPLH
jgi:hypothetical protein